VIEIGNERYSKKGVKQGMGIAYRIIVRGCWHIYRQRMSRAFDGGSFVVLIGVRTRPKEYNSGYNRQAEANWSGKRKTDPLRPKQ